MTRERIRTLPVELSDGTVVYAQVDQTDREQEVSSQRLYLSQLADSLQVLLSDLLSPLSEFACDSITLECGVNLAAESGRLTSLLVGGSADASLKVTIEWKQPVANENREAAS